MSKCETGRVVLVYSIGPNLLISNLSTLESKSFNLSNIDEIPIIAPVSFQ